MTLFQTGSFTLHSGAVSHWKIDCDALTPDDWNGLALIALEFVKPFGSVQGIPRGGLPFADALRKYITLNSNRRLVVDDVLTQGTSIQAAMTTADEGLVVFARGPIRVPGVQALFQMPYL